MVRASLSNVRELRNVIERAVILARGGALEFDLPGATQPVPARPAAPVTDAAQPEFLTEAELLGVKPTTLLARMKKWGLKKPTSN